MNIKFPYFSRDVKKSLFAVFYLFIYSFIYLFLFDVTCRLPQLRSHFWHRLCCQNQELQQLQKVVGWTSLVDKLTGPAEGEGAEGAWPPTFWQNKNNNFLKFFTE